MAVCHELNVFLLRVELCEAVFAAIRMQPDLALEAHYASIFLTNTTASLSTGCTNVTISIILNCDWQRALWTTTKLSAVVGMEEELRKGKI
jgi:hypothetical protein